MMGISIRPARPGDVADVAALTGELGYEVAASIAAPRLAAILGRADQQLFVAESGGRVVAWLHAARAEFLETGAFVIVAGLVVGRQHRRQGIGRALMAEAEEWTRAQGCSIVRLWSSRGRTEAHAFYRSLGYTDVKIQHAFARCVDGSDDDRLQALAPRLAD